MICKAEGLAWDDEPARYMDLLAENLLLLDIRLDVTSRRPEFLRRFEPGTWNFVVLDLLDESLDPPDLYGIRLAKNVAEIRRSDPFFPIFVITNQTGLLTPQLYEGIPNNVNVRYKIGDPYSMALLIRDELRLRGAYTNPRKTFLAAPMINHAFTPEAAEIQHWLNERGQNIKPLDEQQSTAEIVESLLTEMAECRAIVVLCSADDARPDRTHQPRQNVILELGIALGTLGGLRRLIILKQNSAEMPTDLGGVVTLNFRNSPSEVFGQFEERLLKLGVDLSACARPA